MLDHSRTGGKVVGAIGEAMEQHRSSADECVRKQNTQEFERRGSLGNPKIAVYRKHSDQKAVVSTNCPNERENTDSTRVQRPSE